MKRGNKKYTLINCKHCNKSIFKYSFPSYHIRKFCSLFCARKSISNTIYKNSRIKVKCNYCDKEFFRAKSNIKNINRNYCDKSCYINDKTKTKRGKGAYGKASFFKCNYCGKTVGKFNSARKTKRHYCNKECYLKGIYAKILLKCDNCNNTYLYNKKMSKGYKYHFCSKKCKYIYFKNNSPIKGENSPTKREEVRRKISQSKIGVPRPDMVGENNYSWQGGKSFEEYPREFNDSLKNKIRKRDNYICQNCGITEEEHIIVFGRVLDVHHIDYDKKNCKEDNLISLCISCNARANFNKDYWEEYYNNKIEKRRELKCLGH